MDVELGSRAAWAKAARFWVDSDLNEDVWSPTTMVGKRAMSGLNESLRPTAAMLAQRALQQVYEALDKG